MAESSASLANALRAARDGIEEAREQGRQVAERRARDLQQDARGRQRAGEARAEQARRADMLRDMVELSRQSQALKANTRVFRAAGGVSEEVVNLGRRLDVRA